MNYKFILPETLDELKRVSNEHDVEQLYRLALALGMMQAIHDWPYFRRPHTRYEIDEIMEAAKEACKRLLKEPMVEGIQVTNTQSSFSMLFLQTYVGAYLGVIETEKRSPEEMQELLHFVRGRTEKEGIAVIDAMIEIEKRQRDK